MLLVLVVCQVDDAMLTSVEEGMVSLEREGNIFAALSVNRWFVLVTTRACIPLSIQLSGG